MNTVSHWCGTWFTRCHRPALAPAAFPADGSATSRPRWPHSGVLGQQSVSCVWHPVFPVPHKPEFLARSPHRTVSQEGPDLGSAGQRGRKFGPSGVWLLVDTGEEGPQPRRELRGPTASAPAPGRYSSAPAGGLQDWWGRGERPPGKGGDALGSHQEVWGARSGRAHAGRGEDPFSQGQTSGTWPARESPESVCLYRTRPLYRWGAEVRVNRDPVTSSDGQFQRRRGKGGGF